MLHWNNPSSQKDEKVIVVKVGQELVHIKVRLYRCLKISVFLVFAADAKGVMDQALKELEKVNAVRKTSDAALAKLSREYDATQKSLAQSQKNLRKAESNYKSYLEKTAAKAKKDAENKKKAEASAKKRQAEQAKKAAEAKKKADKKKAEQEKKEAAAKKKAEEKARKKRQEEAAKAAKKAKEEAAKAAKMKAEKIKKAQEKIESLEKEKRDLVIKDAPMAKVTATESKLKETKAELNTLLKSKWFARQDRYS